MTRQQELELLAEWLGIEKHKLYDSIGDNGGIEGHGWNPITDDTDFLNMVAGRVDIEFWTSVASAKAVGHGPDFHCTEAYADHNNDKLAAMKHAAYQVCLMAAREWKSGQ